MADKKKTLSVVFKAEDQMSSKMKSISSEGKKAAETVKNFQREIKGLDSKPAETCANNMVATFEKAENRGTASIHNLNSSVKTAMEGTSRCISNTAQRFVEFENKTDQATKSTREYANETEEARRNADRLGDSVYEVGQKSEGAGKLIKGFATALGIGTAIKLVKDYGKTAEDTFKIFEKGTSEVKTLLAGSSQSELSAIDSGTKQFAMDNALLTSEVTPALYNAISAGVDKSEAFNFLGSANKLAVGGVAELNDSVAVLTTITNNYKKQGLEASTASDLLFTTVKKGVTTIPELASSLGEVVPAASASGIAFKDVTAGMATLTASLGAGSTSKATTKLRSMFDELSTTGTNVDKTFKKITGGSFNEFIAKGGTLQDALAKLNDYANKNNLSIKELFNSIEAGGAALILGSTGANMFKENIAAMGEASGATDEAYKTMQNTSTYLDNQISAAKEHMAISTGEMLAEASEPLKRSVLDNMPLIEDTVTDFFEIVSGGIEDISVDLPHIIETVDNGIEFILENGGKVKTVLAGITSVFVAKKTINGVVNFSKALSTSLNATTVLATQTSKVGGVLGSFATGLSGVALPLTVAAGATMAIVEGFKAYDKYAKNKSLEEHFGSITLSLEECNGIAKEILDDGNFEKLSESIKAFDEVDNNILSLNDTLSSINKDNWKINLGFEVDKEEYIANIDGYIENSLELLQDKQYAITLAINTTFGEGETANEWTSSASSVYSELYSDLQKYGEQLKDAVLDGYQHNWTPDTQEAVQGILNSINEIDRKVTESQSAAKLETIKQDFLKSDLSAESFSNLQEGLQTEIETMRKPYNDLRLQLIAEAELEFSENKINEEELNKKISQVQSDYNNNMANLSIKSTSFQTDVINSAYGDSLSQGYDYWKNIDLSSFDNSIEFAESNLQVGFDDLMRNMRIETEKFYDSFDNLSWGDKSAIKDMWAKIEPDQDVLKNTAEKYIEAGETIPDSVRKGILDSAKVGAAIDDQESLYTLLAYNASLNNPEYANMILNAKKSGMDIPEEMILGIALAKPELLTAAGIIAEDTKDSLVESTLSGKSEIESASREAYIEAVLNGMDSQKSDIVRKASELAQLAIASFKGDLSGTAIDLPDNVEGPLMTGARTSLNIKTNALGGIYDSPILTWVAEAGDAEAIIPLNQTQRAYDLWLAAGEQIGVSRSDSILTETSSMYTETNNSIINNASEKIITIKLEGGAELKIPKGTSQQELLELLDENLMPMLINKLNTEIFEGGDEVFDT